MNACARAPGVVKNAATATAAAINFKFIGVILPEYGWEIERTCARGQPALVDAADAMSAWMYSSQSLALYPCHASPNRHECAAI
jgi:hypothetical protein